MLAGFSEDFGEWVVRAIEEDGVEDGDGIDILLMESGDDGEICPWGHRSPLYYVFEARR